MSACLAPVTTKLILVSFAVTGQLSNSRNPTPSHPASQLSSQQPLKLYPSFKEVLDRKKEEIAAEIARTRPPATTAPPPPRPSIFDLGDDTSDSSSDSDDDNSS